MWAQGRHPWRCCLENGISPESPYKSRRERLVTQDGHEAFSVEVGRRRVIITEHLPCAEVFHYVISFQSHNLQITENWNPQSWNNLPKFTQLEKAAGIWSQDCLKSFLFVSRCLVHGQQTGTLSDRCWIARCPNLRALDESEKPWMWAFVPMWPITLPPYSWSYLYLYFPLRMAGVLLEWGFHPTVWWLCFLLIIHIYM